MHHVHETALRRLVQGIPNLMTGRMKLDAELRSFHDHHLKARPPLPTKRRYRPSKMSLSHK